MNVFKFAAGLGLAGLAMVAPAEAQQVVQTIRTTTVHRETHTGGPMTMHRHRQKICRTHWRNHHRVRRCTWR